VRLVRAWARLRSTLQEPPSSRFSARAIDAISAARGIPPGSRSGGFRTELIESDFTYSVDASPVAVGSALSRTSSPEAYAWCSAYAGTFDVTLLLGLGSGGPGRHPPQAPSDPDVRD